MAGRRAGGWGCGLTSPARRHSRAFLHALLHSDNTAALHHLTVHNVAYQVGQAGGRPGRGRQGRLGADGRLPSVRSCG